jgi:hypothetical protein
MDKLEKHDKQYLMVESYHEEHGWYMDWIKRKEIVSIKLHGDYQYNASYLAAFKNGQESIHRITFNALEHAPKFKHSWATKIYEEILPTHKTWERDLRGRRTDC